MDRFLHRAKTEGQFHSSGTVSLDIKQALAKLKNHLLQPEDTLLYILQSAVASGATRLAVTYTEDDIEVVHDGFFPSPDEALKLPEWALLRPDSADKVARHRWGLALASTLSPAGQGMELLFQGGNGLQMRSTGIRSIIATNPGVNRLRIPVVRTWWRRWLGGGLHPAITSLAQRGYFAPLELSINRNLMGLEEWGTVATVKERYEDGSTVETVPAVTVGGKNGRRVARDHHLLEVRWAAVKEQTILGLPTKSKASFAVGQWPKGPAAKLPERCRAAAAVRATRPSLLEIVQYGVLLRLTTTVPAYSMDISNLWLLMADDKLPTDLSFLQARPDPDFEERLQELREDLERICGATNRSRYYTDDEWKLGLLAMKTRSKAGRVVIGNLSRVQA